MVQTIPHWLTKRAELTPNEIALKLMTGETLTYVELMKKSQSLAKKLATIGIREGNHIGVLSTNSVEMVVLIHALSYLQCVIVMLNTRLTKHELIFQIEKADVTHLISTET